MTAPWAAGHATVAAAALADHPMVEVCAGTGVVAAVQLDTAALVIDHEGLTELRDGLRTALDAVAR